MLGVTNVVAKNPEVIKSVGKGIAEIILTMAKSRRT
jgi:hypothetical protein